jgi:hypothetical protein
MLRLPAQLPLATLFALYLVFPPCASAQTPSDRFDLHGKVINAATSEPVSGALVQLPGQETQFSRSDGSFVFTNLPRAQLAVMVRKPGFFNDQELGRWGPAMFPQIAVPAEADVIIKLTPEGIIFGQVKDENAEPMDGVTVRAERWQIQDGRKQLQSAGETTTDDEGNFRIAELLPGSYCLAFLPANRGGRIFRTLKRRTEAEQGYGLEFYPGTSDAASAGALEIRAGAQQHIIHTFSHQRLFQVAGVMRPANPESFPNITLVNSSGEPIQTDIRLNPKTGEFQISGVPPGTYLLSATASLGPKAFDQVPGKDSTPSSVTLPIQVNADLSGLILNLGSAVAAVVQIRDETERAPDPNTLHQLFVRLVPRDFPNSGLGIMVPPAPGDHQSPRRFESVTPGIYTVEATPMAAGYVASLRCGSVDLLRDDLTIAPGSPPAAIEITLRSDSAQLSVTLTNQHNAAGLVIYSREYPRRSMLVPVYNGNTSVPNLAPGSYQLLALNDTSQLEYRNPAVVEKYLIHAIPVTLQPGDNATVRVEVQEPPESRP